MTGQGAMVAANPINTVVLLGLLSLLPFLLMMTTSFLKFCCRLLDPAQCPRVLSKIPPNPVDSRAVGAHVYLCHGPCRVRKIYDEPASLRSRRENRRSRRCRGEGAAVHPRDAREEQAAHAQTFWLATCPCPQEVEFFSRVGDRRMGPPSVGSKSIDARDNLIVLIPCLCDQQSSPRLLRSVSCSSCRSLVIDMVISNILLAMGMHMLSPVVISLPFKLLLFVMTDGWTLLVRGLLQGYM